MQLILQYIQSLYINIINTILHNEYEYKQTISLFTKYYTIIIYINIKLYQYNINTYIYIQSTNLQIFTVTTSI